MTDIQGWARVWPAAKIEGKPLRRGAWYRIVSAGRSKVVLEKAAGEVGCVRGLVPPFNRPMTWLRHGIVRPGDRPAFPPGAAATNDGLLRAAAGAGYEWVRVSMRPLVSRSKDPLRAPFREGGVTVVPHHYDGFDAKADRLLDLAVERGATFVLTLPGDVARPD